MGSSFLPLIRELVSPVVSLSFQGFPCQSGLSCPVESCVFPLSFDEFYPHSQCVVKKVLTVPLQLDLQLIRDGTGF